MSAIITNKFRVHNAEQFYESFSEAAPTTYYLWIGRPQAFSTVTGGGTDSAPPTPTDTVGDEYRYFRDKAPFVGRIIITSHCKIRQGSIKFSPVKLGSIAYHHIDRTPGMIGSIAIIADGSSKI